MYTLQAQLCKALANPKRLQILSVLKNGEKTVTELVQLLQFTKANVSQHLVFMRSKGILKSRKQGVNIYYSIANPKVIVACNLIKEVLSEIIKKKSP